MGTPIFKGDRVAIAPHSDFFMMGERFAEVTSIGRKWIHVKGERSGRSFKFWKGSDQIETTAARVTVNDSQSLYVIRHESGYSCLGFDVCTQQARAYGDWLMGKGHPDAASWLTALDKLPRGHLGKYQIREHMLAAIKARFDATGERCPIELVPEFIGHEGERVELVDCYGETRRFRIGKSTGWIPVHLEIERNANGGGPVYGRPFASIRFLGR